MAKPRVFVSSTFYDLKFIRREIERFVLDQVGFEPVLFERSSVTYKPDQSLEESCYDEIKNCQLVVLVIGGKVGSESQSSEAETLEDSIVKRKSITFMEYENARNNNIPIFTFVLSDVLSEYRTYLANKENSKFVPAHVDHPAVFELISDIYSREKNNSVYKFQEVDDIIDTLRSQWAGLFFEYLQKAKSDDLALDISSKIDRLDALYGKLLTLAEKEKNEANDINTSDVVEQLKEEFFKRDLDSAFSNSEIVRHLTGSHGHSLDALREAFENSKNVKEFKNAISKPDGTKPSCWMFRQAVDAHLDKLMKERHERVNNVSTDTEN